MTVLPPDPPVQEIRIQFEGICVNFRQVDFPFLPAAHRIVLINASTISNVWGHNIGLHTAGFSTSLDPTHPSIPLQGSQIHIANPLTTGEQTGVTYHPSYYEFMPFLTNVTPGIAGASLALLLGHNPSLASCYFDVDYGRIGAEFSPRDAVMTVVHVKTTSTPTIPSSDPFYLMKPFPSGLSWAPIQTVLPQRATTNMYFWNEEVDPCEGRDIDFLLSYLVVNWPPGPEPKLAKLNLPKIPKDHPPGVPNRKSTLCPLVSDVGCSNSNYP